MRALRLPGTGRGRIGRNLVRAVLCAELLLSVTFTATSQTQTQATPPMPGTLVDAVSYTHLDVYKRQPRRTLRRDCSANQDEEGAYRDHPNPDHRRDGKEQVRSRKIFIICQHLHLTLESKSLEIKS